MSNDYSVCEACLEGEHLECDSEDSITDAPGYMSSDGVRTLAKCCCGEYDKYEYIPEDYY